MAIAFDAESVLVVGTGDRTQSHNPVGTPRGVLIIVVHEVGTDTVAGVTYDGTALVEVPLSPLLHTTPETGSIHAFFLGASVPTADPATWAVDVTDTSDYIAACFTVTAAQDTEVHDTSTFDSGATTAPSATLTITKDSFVAGGLYSGLAAPGATEVAGTAEVVTGDLGADSGEISRGDSIKTADFAYGWTQASDDGAVLAIAINEKSVTNAPAENAAGTGAASGASVASAPTAGLAAGTGTAYDATTNQVRAYAGHAAGTGTAYNAQVDTGLSTVRGGDGRTLLDFPGVTRLAQLGFYSNHDRLVLYWQNVGETIVATNAPAGVATGTGTALDAAVSLAPTAELSSGTGAALVASASLQAAAENAAGTGAASAATISLAPTAGIATGTGSAFDATGAAAISATAEAAAGTGAAAASSTAVAPTADFASGTGTAYDTAMRFVLAEAAAGSGAASDAAASVAPTAEVSAGAGSASAATMEVAPVVAVATGTGVAGAAAAAIEVSAGIGAGTGVASDATVSISADVSANAENAAGTGAAQAVTVAIEAAAGAAAGTGAASDSTTDNSCRAKRERSSPAAYQSISNSRSCSSCTARS